VPGQSGLRVRRYRIQDIAGGARCHFHVSKQYTYTDFFIKYYGPLHRMNTFRYK
jgi:hypothetical protein